MDKYCTVSLYYVPLSDVRFSLSAAFTIKNNPSHAIGTCICSVRTFFKTSMLQIFKHIEFLQCKIMVIPLQCFMT